MAEKWPWLRWLPEAKKREKVSKTIIKAQSEVFNLNMPEFRLSLASYLTIWSEWSHPSQSLEKKESSFLSLKLQFDETFSIPMLLGLKWRPCISSCLLTAEIDTESISNIQYIVLILSVFLLELVKLILFFPRLYFL